jgi:TonB-dependent receptor
LEESIFAGYLQGTYRWGDFTFIGGVRYEKTDLDTAWRASNFKVDATYLPDLTETEKSAMNQLVQDTVGDIGFTGPAGGFDFGDVVDDIDGGGDYSNWLPSFVANWRVADTGHVFRFAWTNTLTRPDFRELVPYDGGQVNQQLADAGVIELTNRDDEFDLGNPGLVEQTAMNWDLAWEYYFGTNRRNTVSVTLFRKDLDNFLQEDTYIRDVEVLIDPSDPSLGTEIVDGSTNFWTNAGARTIDGVELSGYFTMADLLPTWDWIHGLGFTPNYTYITGSQEDPVYDLDELANGNIVVIDTVESGNLTNQPEHIVNLQFFYQWQRLNVRMSYNYISEIQQNPSTAAITASTFNASQSFWDLSVQYRLFQDKDVRLFVEIDNLTNQEDDLEYIGPQEALYVTGYEEIGRRYVFGIRGSF